MKRVRIKFKFDKTWITVRELWFELYAPDYRGMYQCGLCLFEVHIDETTLDHIMPKGSHPKLKYDLTNLQPAHGVCNNRKGSMSMEAYERRFGPAGSLV